MVETSLMYNPTKSDSMVYGFGALHYCCLFEGSLLIYPGIFHLDFKAYLKSFLLSEAFRISWNVQPFPSCGFPVFFTLLYCDDLLVWLRSPPTWYEPFICFPRPSSGSHPIIDNNGCCQELPSVEAYGPSQGPANGWQDWQPLSTLLFCLYQSMPAIELGAEF